MKKTKIKAFAFVLSIIMLVAALPAYAQPTQPNMTNYYILSTHMNFLI